MASTKKDSPTKKGSSKSSASKKKLAAAKKKKSQAVVKQLETITAASPALDALATSMCRNCILGILEKASGRIPQPTDTLKDLFAGNCTGAVIVALKKAFKKCPNSNSGAQFGCGTTVADLQLRACP